MRPILRETLLMFRRAPLLSILAVTTIAFALFVLGLFGLVALNAQQALQSLAERVEVVLYLRHGTPVDVVTTAMGDIQAFPEVDAVTYVTEDEALSRARRELVEFQGALDDLETNPLPASLEIRLKPQFRNTEHVAAVSERLRGFWFAEDVRAGGDWVAKLDRLRDIAAAVGLVLGAGFVAAATIIIGTTIRMTVLARAREIDIMRWVGATDGFVRRPFLLDGALKGALGGSLALPLCYAAYLAVNAELALGAFFTNQQMALVVGVGTILGFAASAVSVGRHLGRV